MKTFNKMTLENKSEYNDTSKQILKMTLNIILYLFAVYGIFIGVKNCFDKYSEKKIEDDEDEYETKKQFYFTKCNQQILLKDYVFT